MGTIIRVNGVHNHLFGRMKSSSREQVQVEALINQRGRRRRRTGNKQTPRTKWLKLGEQ